MAGYADLHNHTVYSDGTMTVAELLDEAAENGVSLLAIADHNVLAGSRELMELAPRRGIRALPAVEIDTFGAEDGHHHILGYGIDLYDEAFAAFAGAMRGRLDAMSDRLVGAMAAAGAPVSPEDYASFRHVPALGGWKALQYFRAIGLTASLMQGARFYNEYGCTYDLAGFASIGETCAAIRAAGGRAVFAHPGETIGGDDAEAVASALRRFAGYGLDGVECLYPSHSEAVTRACLTVCDELDLLVTSGSDCHGSFTKTRVGEMRVPTERLRLGDLIAKIR